MFINFTVFSSQSEAEKTRLATGSNIKIINQTYRHVYEILYIYMPTYVYLYIYSCIAYRPTHNMYTSVYKPF